MIKILKSEQLHENLLRVGRQNNTAEQVQTAVSAIIQKVRAEGDTALREYTLNFDKVAIDDFLVSEAEIDAAFAATDQSFKDILNEAAENIRSYHRHQLREDVRIEKEDGIVLGQRFLPIEKVGLYVPGGTAAYPSSVLMNAIPAKLAGCRQIVMVTPPNAKGEISADILTAARISGVTAVYKVGGAQAIAALAYGTESIPQVDKIVGPGNIYVATAKRQVFGQVDIDMIAGPSEILIIADEQANTAYLAADMLSQAEHDMLAASILICPSELMANAVSQELDKQLACLPRQSIAATSIENEGLIIIEPDLQKACALANAIAPEHLELAVEEPFTWLQQIKNAGSVFLGTYTPEPLGDYWAGPNHVLPTLGSARFAGPLSVDDFVKRSSYLYYTQEALAKAGDKVAAFADREGLNAHAGSIRIRMEEK